MIHSPACGNLKVKRKGGRRTPGTFEHRLSHEPEAESFLPPILGFPLPLLYFASHLIRSGINFFE